MVAVEVHARRHSMSPALALVQPYAGFVGLLAIPVFGVLLGASEPDAPVATAGWIATLAGTVRLYPQLFLNWQRRSVEGLSLDAQVYAVFGFGAYALFNCGLAKAPSVLLPSGAYANLHTLLVSMLVLYQCSIFKRGAQVVSSTCQIVVGAAFAFMLVFLLVGGVLNIGILSWSNFIDVTCYFHVLMTAIKYAPQVELQYTRKSTVGFSVYGVLYDGLFGAATLASLLLQGTAAANPWLLAIACITVSYNTVLLLQHAVLYRNRWPADGDDDCTLQERRALIHI
ncbi:cystinosin precursor [Achlya hypogyna]|uniref:Cystinosin n=1 Tax=Achlya hypogyna TaxID=1202772 RepID=A0A1V9YFA2_ACHHY|nr:cystinosin precursor [Achlya hypogyna]